MTHRLFLGGILAIVLLSTGSAVRGDPIHFRSGTVDPQFAPAAAVANDVAFLAGQHDGRRSHLLVRFARPLSTSERMDLERGGLRVQTYLGNHAYFAAVDRVDADALAAVPALRAALPIARAFKQHPDLVAGRMVPWEIVEDPTGENAPADEVRTDLVDEATVALYVLFHPDVDLISEGNAIVQQHGAWVRSYLHSLNGMVIELPYGEIDALTDEDGVMYVEPPLPQFTEMNNSNRQRTGADLAQAPPYNLDGNGVVAMIYDGGSVLTTHNDFGGRATSRDSASLSDHSTHVAGTVGGDGANSSGTYRGMAPGVLIESYGFETDGPLQEGFLYTDPGDIEVDYADGINNHDVDITNNSIGTNTAPNGFPCEWTGDYNITSALIDAVVRGSLGAPHRVVWANGNERQTSRCGSFYNTTAPPAGAKNHITVGALNSNDDSMTSFSSWGPVDDGRIKPDISGPGCQSDDDHDVTSCSSSGNYTGKCGTSMASPTVTGISALLLQDFRLTYPGEPDFRNSTLKALLAHTAEDVEEVGPDYKTGYGSVRIVPAIEQMRSGSFLEKEVDQGEFYQVLVVVPAGTSQLKVTIAWDDVPAAPAIQTPQLVNDLDLLVMDQVGNSYFPWTLDPLFPDLPAVRTMPDHLNNIEQVVIDNPLPGSYLVKVTGSNVPVGPQVFSLVASPPLIDCSPQGIVKLDKPQYRCQDVVEVTVIDCDLNTDDTQIEATQAQVTSDSDQVGQTVFLVETGPQTSTFRNAFAVSDQDLPGMLYAVEGDAIHATYIAEDHRLGGQDVPVVGSATMDCTPPAVTNLEVVDIDPRNARVVFNTDEPATATLRYGLSCDNLDTEVSLPGSRVAHSLSLTDLSDDLTYYFELEVVDAAGNVNLEDNNGACHTFTTPEIPDYYTKQYSSGFDLANTTIEFAPNGSVDYYLACRSDALVLPTDPVGGDALPLGDISSQTIQLGLDQVLLYGVSYNVVHVNANGNLTFINPDSDSSESIEEHFEVPRVSAFFDDLDPSEGGIVSYRHLEDRLAVTFENVSEDSAGNDNTFQIELFFNGRIRLTYLGMDGDDAIVGLSAGGGVPENYYTSNLFGLPICDPRPPSAASRTVIVGQDRETTIALLASDEGLPDPPSGLAYHVTALPVHELRDAATAQVITPGDLPYALAGGGNEVIYRPADGFVGEDGFEFVADDGGSPPEGGESNLGTVMLQVAPVLSVPYFDDFPTDTFRDDRWAINRHANIDVLGANEPSPPYSLRLNGTPIGSDELISHMVDLSQQASARVVYRWQRTGDGNSPETGEDLWVEYANEEQIWIELAAYPGGGADMTVFDEATIDLPADALHDSFRLRFRARGSAGIDPRDDWFVDDVAVTFTDGPLASGGQAIVLQNMSEDVALFATDPNQDPLTFVITALPQHGGLADPGIGEILPQDLPYALSGGNVVTYVPALDYVGNDAFSFYATDGFYPSNEATVAVVVEPVLAAPFVEPFAAADFTPGRWGDTGGANVDTLGENEPSPPYAARLNGSPSGGDVLQSYAINLEGLDAMYVSYYWQRTGGGESPESGEDLVVEYFDGAATWQELARYDGGGPDMSQFEYEQISLPPQAHHRNFRLRFSNSSGGTTASDDWFVDDIVITSANAPVAFDQVVGVAKFGAADITLDADDPNEDDLTYTILSLPAEGELIDLLSSEPITPDLLPYTLVGGGNVARYLPPLGFEGQVSLTFQAADDLFPSGVAEVAVAVGGKIALHNFPLNTDPGWSTEGLWAFGVPQGNNFDPVSGFTGSNVYGYNLEGPYENNLSATYLTTDPMDCTILVNTELVFHRWLGLEDSDYDHATIEVSNDGLVWTVVWEHVGNNIVDLAWLPYSYDIADLADGEAAVAARWAMGPTDDSAQFAGWNLDDIAIIGDVQIGEGDIDGNTIVDLIDYRAMNACLAGPGLLPTPPLPMLDSDCLEVFDFDEDGDVDLFDYAEFGGRFGQE